ncbi:MAG: CbiX/SirB N-terminal domain-containing protein [Pseudomonadota bacterium]|nr:CbiX/SirB N-terminal domain-containing protein [Pseudomonadota bacterium]
MTDTPTTNSQTIDPGRNESALIIIAHGSRLASANEEFFELVSTVANTTEGFGQVLPAFLEAAPPTLLQACQTAVDAGARQIAIYPLFFNNGRHVGKDIPALVAEAMDHFPSIDFELRDYFGSNPQLAQTVIEHLKSS